MDLMKYKSFHFIGIGGMGMRALAEILLEKGLSISGSDLADSPAIENFKARGASIFIGHAPSNVKGAGCVIISSAISSNNPELVEAGRENAHIHVLLYIKEVANLTGKHFPLIPSEVIYHN